jgi:hypothetical protein
VLAAPQNRLPGWIVIRRARSEARRTTVSHVPHRSFRFVCSMCGSVGDPQSTPSKAVTSALDHVRFCVASGPLGPQKLWGANLRVSLTLQSHYQRMLEYLSADPELRQRLGLNGPLRRSVIWQVVRGLPEPLVRHLNDLAVVIFKKRWAELAAEIAVQIQRG